MWAVLGGSQMVTLAVVTLWWMRSRHRALSAVMSLGTGAAANLLLAKIGMLAKFQAAETLRQGSSLFGIFPTNTKMEKAHKGSKSSG